MTSTAVSCPIRCDEEVQEGPPPKKAKCDVTASTGDGLAGVPRPLLSTSHVSSDPLTNSMDMTEKTTNVLRYFDIQTMGGASFSVSLAGQSTVGHLLEKISKEQDLGFCFTLLKMDGQLLDDPSLPLPIEDKLQCVIENPKKLCKAAAKILRARPYTVAKVSQHSICHPSLGTCRKLGSIPIGAWPSNVSNCATSDTDLNEEVVRDDLYHLDYGVYELTLVDGANKLLRFIGVISSGSVDANTGMFGSIYLRPSLEEVGKIKCLGDNSSGWSFKRGKNKWSLPYNRLRKPQWYTMLTTPIQWRAIEWNKHQMDQLDLLGGDGRGELRDHCALALAVAQTNGFESQNDEDESSNKLMESDKEREEEGSEDYDEEEEEDDEEGSENQDEDEEEEEPQSEVEDEEEGEDETQQEHDAEIKQDDDEE